jgi:hypothetical protein
LVSEGTALIYLLGVELRDLSERLQVVHVDDEIVSDADVLGLVQELENQAGCTVRVDLDLLLVHQVFRILASVLLV